MIYYSNVYIFQVDVTWFYSNCLIDTCGCNQGGDCECFCTSVSAYAHQCCQQGVTVDWRAPRLCRKYDNQNTFTNLAKPYCQFDFASSSMHIQLAFDCVIFLSCIQELAKTPAVL